MSSSSPTTSLLLVIGSGPGIGLSTSTLFASKKFTQIVLLSRNATRLASDKASILASSPSVKITTFVQDIADSTSFKKTLSEIEALGEVSCVFFNAARVEPSALMEYGEEEVIKDFMTTNIALLTTARWALPLLAKTSDKPALLVTNSLLWEQPYPAYFSLSMVKTSQRSLVRMLQATSPKIHIALVNVGGVVSPEDKVFNPTAIAETMWEVYAQEEGKWVGETNIVA